MGLQNPTRSMGTVDVRGMWDEQEAFGRLRTKGEAVLGRDSEMVGQGRLIVGRRAIDRGAPCQDGFQSRRMVSFQRAL